MRHLAGWLLEGVLTVLCVVAIYPWLGLYALQRWRRKRKHRKAIRRSLGIAACLLFFGCATKNGPLYAPYSPPKVGLAAPGFVRVGQRWPLTIVLRGEFPHGPIVLQATAERRLLVNKTVDVDLARYYLYHIYFDETFYVAVAQERKQGGFEWDGLVRVDVRTAELMFTTSMGWLPGAPIAAGSKIVQLSCWQCETDNGEKRDGRRKPIS